MKRFKRDILEFDAEFKWEAISEKGGEVLTKGLGVSSRRSTLSIREKCKGGAP